MNDQLVERERGIKEQARRVLDEAFPNNDDELLRELVSDEFVNHEAPPGTPPGLGGITFYMHMLAEAFSDQHWEIHKTVAEGDTVVMYCTHSGRHTGEFFGVPASGRDFAYKQMHMVRLVNGKGVEHWVVRDDASLMRQLTEGRGESPSS